jgi:TolB protein
MNTHKLGIKGATVIAVAAALAGCSWGGSGRDTTTVRAGAEPTRSPAPEAGVRDTPADKTAGSGAYDPFNIAISADRPAPPPSAPRTSEQSSRQAAKQSQAAEQIQPGPHPESAQAKARTRREPVDPHRPAPAETAGHEPVAQAPYSDILSGLTWGVESTLPGRSGGGNLSRVSFALEGADFDPSVSPDGQQIVFASTQHSHNANIYIKNVQSRVVTQLTQGPHHDVMPRISPDGSRIAFASNRSGNWDVFVMPITGGQAVQVTTDSAHELHPTWSPDGRHLVFCRLGQVSGRWEIWVTDVLNTGVAHFLGHGLFPEWCPTPGTGRDGADQILFQRSRDRGDRAFSIWVIDYHRNGTAGTPTEIVSSPVAACINPSWSPDGQWVGFATVPNPAQWDQMTQFRPAAADLWMIGANGTGLVRLTSDEGVNLMPTWGRDDRIYFISDRGGVDNIWSMNVRGAILAATGKSPETGTRITGQKERTPVASVPDDDR